MDRSERATYTDARGNSVVYNNTTGEVKGYWDVYNNFRCAVTHKILETIT